MAAQQMRIFGRGPSLRRKPQPREDRCDVSALCRELYARNQSFCFSSSCGAALDMLRMKAVLVAVLALVGPAMSQYQSFYAGGGWAYPGVLPQFADEALADRVGQASNTTTTTTTTTMSPEAVMYSQVAQWPEDRQPFWFMNREHIQDHLGRPQQEQSTQRQPQSQPDSQPQAQPQPQDVPNTRSQAPATQGDLQNQPEIRSQVQRNRPQAQNQPGANRPFQWWLQNEFFAPRQQSRWAQNQPDTQTQNIQEQRRWRGRPGTKTVYW